MVIIFGNVECIVVFYDELMKGSKNEEVSMRKSKYGLNADDV